MKILALSAAILLGATAIGHAAINPVSFDFMTPGVLPADAKFARASSGTYFDSEGNLQSAENDVPRWTYDFTSGALLGLLNEPSRTNYVNNTNVGAQALSPEPPDSAHKHKLFHFTNDFSDWTPSTTSKGGGVTFLTSGGAELHVVGAGITRLSTAIPTVIGHAYCLRVKAGDANNRVHAGTKANNQDVLVSTRLSAGEDFKSFIATSTTTYLQFTNARIGTTGTIFHYSVAEEASTLPTNWLDGSGGLQSEVTALGTIRGMPYFIYHVFGFSTGATRNLYFQNNTQVLTATRSHWVGSFYHSLAGPDVGVSTYRNDSNTRNPDGLAIHTYSTRFTPSRNLQRTVNVYTPDDELTTSTQSMFRIDIGAAGVSVDTSSVLAGEQLEHGTEPSSLILAGVNPAKRAVETLDLFVGNNTYTSATITRANGTETIENPEIIDGYYRVPNSVSPLQKVELE